MEERMRDLERQVAAVQRRCRFLFGVAVVAPAVGLTLMASRPHAQAAEPEAAEKKRTVLKAPFDVVGADGKRLMTVEEKKGGGATVWFYRPENDVNAIVDC